MFKAKLISRVDGSITLAVANRSDISMLTDTNALVVPWEIDTRLICNKQLQQTNSDMCF